MNRATKNTKTKCLKTLYIQRLKHWAMPACTVLRKSCHGLLVS